jgi:hypothetical protein
MKQLSKVALLALGFGLVSMAFFSMHNRTVKAQESTAATNNAQIALVCESFDMGSCTGWMTVGPYGANLPLTIQTPGQLLIVTDMECVTSGTAGEYGDCSLYAGEFNLAEAGAIAGPHGLSIMGLHLTTGIAFGVPPEAYSSGTPQSITLQGYLIPTPPAAAGGS